MQTWELLLIDFSIIALVASAIIIAGLILRHRYERIARTHILCQIILPTGWSEYHVVKVDPTATSVCIKGNTYLLHPGRQRYTLFPLNPPLSLSWLQTVIRIETWELNNPNPVTAPAPVATVQQIKATLNQLQAAEIGIQLQEMEAQADILRKLPQQIPDKRIVYIGMVLLAVLNIGCLIILLQLGGIWG